MKPSTLGVVGLGALGGSVAWQAALAGVKRVIGYSAIPKEAVAAVKVGAVTEIAPNIERVVALSDLVVVDSPPQKTQEILGVISKAIVDRPVYCTDLAGVKGNVVETAAKLRLDRHFAGSHPLVNLKTTGFDSARSDLLSGALVYVTPLPEGELAAAEVADFWHRTIGAEPVTLEAAAHDSMLAWTSHLPQVIASTLAAAFAKRGPRGVTYSRGAIEATQPAKADAAAWAELLLENKEQVLLALDSMLGETGRLIADIEAEDARRVRNWLESGKRWRERLDD